MILEKAVDRLREVASGQPSIKTRERMRVEAEQITRTGATMAHVAIIEQAVLQLIVMLYEQDIDGTCANYDYDGRILIPVPWGSAGWAKWGLRSWEARCLRKVWTHRLRKSKPMLFTYNRRRWFVRADLYPTEADAIAWLQANGILIEEWQAVLHYEQKRRDKWPSRRVTK